MEVDEGFILGVHNYCDRWCEKCRFTSRCRVFADGAEHEAVADRELKAVAEAPPVANDIPDTPSWLEEALSEINEASIQDLPDPPPLPANFLEIEKRARAYCQRVWELLKARGLDQLRDNDDPISIIQWFSTLISAKVDRALSGLAEFDGCRDYPADHEGSAKVALMGIDQSITAWQDSVSIGRISFEVADECSRELEWLSNQLEVLIPRARAFVRPGFGEPDEVRRLESSDWS